MIDSSEAGAYDGVQLSLRAVTDAYIATAHEFSCSPQGMSVGRFRDRTPTSEEFVNATWRGSQICMAAVDRASRLAGLACAYNYNPPSSIYLAFTPARLDVVPAAVAESMYLLAGVCFTQLPIERVYVELAGYVSRSDDLFSRLFQRVASFPRHVYWNDQLWDVDHWAMSRQTFIQECDHLDRATQAARGVSDIGTALRRAVALVPGCLLDGDQVVAGDSLAAVELAVVLEQALQIPAEAAVECFSNRHSVPVGEVLALRGLSSSPRPAESTA